MTLRLVFEAVRNRGILWRGRGDRVDVFAIAAKDLPYKFQRFLTQ